MTTISSLTLTFDNISSSPVNVILPIKATNMNNISIAVSSSFGNTGTTTNRVTNSFTLNNGGQTTVIISETVAGSMTGFGNGTSTWGSGAQYLTSVTWSLGPALTSLSGAFNGCTKLISVPPTLPSLSVTDISYMFYGAIAFNQNLNSWFVGNVNNTSYMFNGATVFNNNNSSLTWCLPSTVTNTGMFAGSAYYITYGTNISCILTQIQLVFNNTGTSPVNVTLPIQATNMNNISIAVSSSTGTTTYIGKNTFTLNNGQLISVQITELVANSMIGFGSGSTPWTGGIYLTYITSWKIADAISSLSGAFNGCTSLSSVPPTLPSSVTDLSYMFYGAINFNGDISQWNTSNVTDTDNMFCGATSFNQNLNWDVSKVTDMTGMFYGATYFNADISLWNTSNVTDMCGMFNGAINFNADLSKWKTTNVTDMSWMFYNATAFNSYLNGWNVSKVTNMNGMFAAATSFNNGNSFLTWCLSSGVDIGNMFTNSAYSNAPYSQKFNCTNIPQPVPQSVSNTQTNKQSNILLFIIIFIMAVETFYYLLKKHK